MEISNQNIKKVVIVLLVVVVLCFIFRGFGPRYHYSREGGVNIPSITVSGHGEVKAVPDIANIYFTISKDAKTVKEAQAGVAAIEKKALDVLKAKGIAEKDIKTTDSSFYPKYDYSQTICPRAVETISYCPPGKQTLTGYTASESITVKIRNAETVGEIMQALGGVGVSNLSGPNFAIDDEDALEMQARKEAIEDAKAKAKVLAKDLGVRIVRITSFSEGGGYGGPIYYAKDMAVGQSAGMPAPAELPKGENTVSSDVTITYEIR